MAADFEVTGRLAEGFTALDTTQTYVSAAAARGYRHPDLTAHSMQVRDWYGTEDGLDLRALEADCVVLRAAAQSLAEALRWVRAALAAVTSAWGGEGAGAAIDFLVRHGDRAERVAAAVEAAARSCERLRDELWRIVDGKVDAVVSFDDRTRAQRPVWLTAARTVIAGPVSEETAGVVDSEITPFVATAVSGEWVAAMRAAVSAVTACYRAAVEEMVSRPPVRFDIPGNLGPTGGPPLAPGAVAAPAVSAPVAPVAFAPGSSSVPTASDPPPPVSAAAPAAVAPAAVAPAAEPTPAPPSAVPPAVPGATPAAPGEPASVLGGLPGRVADALGSMFTGASPAPDGLAGLSAPGAADPVDRPDLDSGLETGEDAVLEDDSPDEQSPDGESEAESGVQENDEESDEESEPEPPAEVREPECPAGGEPAPVAPDVPESTPEPVAAVPAPAPVADPPATPCEIAADELPQVGQ